ncbi:MAG TPA: hypothetical protein DCM14_08425 [Clostridiales bacterium UBA8153]|nr:hypothetical protein [Clostridiales bacterium UBA8153]
MTCGLSKGGLLGLKWVDVDLDGRTLTVRRQLQWLKGQDGKMEPVFNEPKSARARRTIHLPVTANTALRAHRVRQLEERLLLGEAWCSLLP